MSAVDGSTTRAAITEAVATSTGPVRVSTTAVSARSPTRSPTTSANWSAPAASRPTARRTETRRPVHAASSTTGILRTTADPPVTGCTPSIRRNPHVTYVIAEPCVDVLDKACIEECPVDCIYEGGRMLYIHPDECVDCGACEPVCPVEAIFYEDDLPEKWRDYTQANVDFFEDLGSPGGAAKVGKTEKDPALIANLPPQAE